MPLPRLVIDFLLHRGRRKTFSLSVPQRVQLLEGQAFKGIKLIALIELFRLP